MDHTEKFCPFIHAACRRDCKFRCSSTDLPQGAATCLIASKLDKINEIQHDDFKDILDKMDFYIGD